MEKIKRFIECLLPVTACNIKCDYCYVVQRNGREMQMPELKYSAKTIGEALSKERWGGTCYFSICGAGETLLPVEIIDITHEILKQGHFVNLTTNGTISKRIDELLNVSDELLKRLHFSFSFHFLELKKINKIDEFFYNIKKVKSAGCSFIVQINLCDEYIPYLEEIKELCIEHVGSMPQVAATRKENNLKNDIQLYTEIGTEQYIDLGNKFNSPLFSFTMKNFGKKQKGFCYAGDWGGTLNLGTGIFSRCYSSNIKQNIFEDPKKDIDFCAIGRHCTSLFCMNSSHFLSLGMIPDDNLNITYAKLRNRKEAMWYSEEMEFFLNSKLCESNSCYGISKKIKVELYAVYELLYRIGRKFKHTVWRKK